MLDLLPVVYRNPFTGEVEIMPAEMVKANLYSFAHPINLEDAARIALKRDEENATNFLLSVQDCAVLSMPVSEAMDEVSVEFETSAVRSS